jgi:Domain of unknown function (DUF4331)
VTLASSLTTPPVNIGPRSTPNYAATFTNAAIHDLGQGRKVFTGQRAEGFFVDLGSIFDLATLRPFQNLHLIPSAAAVGVNGTQGLNAHTIAIQVPLTDLTKGHKKPTDVSSADSVIGVWASTKRQASNVWDAETQSWHPHGSFHQVPPYEDTQFAKYVLHAELAGLLPVLYPGVFPNLAAYKKPRADLAAILLTGIPPGVVPGFQNFTGSVQADMLRLNLAVPPTTSNPKPLGLVAGEAAGFPNGRRVFDDVVTVELRAVAGLTIPLVNSSFKPDAAAAAVQDGTSNTNPPYLNSFPYLGTPAGGYQTTPGTPHT